MTDHLNDPDFTDSACVDAWEDLVDELEQAEMTLVEAERTWLSVSTTLVLARLQLGLVSGQGGSADRDPTGPRRWRTAPSATR